MCRSDVVRIPSEAAQADTGVIVEVGSRSWGVWALGFGVQHLCISIQSTFPTLVDSSAAAASAQSVAPAPWLQPTHLTFVWSQCLNALEWKPYIFLDGCVTARVLSRSRMTVESAALVKAGGRGWRRPVSPPSVAFTLNPKALRLYGLGGMLCHNYNQELPKP